MQCVKSEEWLETLKRDRLFGSLGEEALRHKLLPLAAERHYAAGEVLLRPQQTEERLGLILEGRVQILQLFPSGASSLMAVLRPGGLLGVDLVFTRTLASPYHAVASEDTRVLYLPAAPLTRPGPLTPEECMAVMRQALLILSHDNMKKHYRLTILSQRGLRQRVLAYLSMQATRRKRASFSIPFSREELASYLCVNRSALSHELRQMEQDGLIRFRKNRFTLLTPPE